MRVFYALSNHNIFSMSSRRKTNPVKLSEKQTSSVLSASRESPSPSTKPAKQKKSEEDSKMVKI